MPRIETPLPPGTTPPGAASLNTQVANAIAAVARAQDELAFARDRALSAQRVEALALNAVNEAQKHFDALAAEVKKSAPPGSDWQRRNERGEPSVCTR